MKASTLQSIQRAFEEAGVRFIVVGGLAVVAHGYLRATHDADLVIELLPDSIGRAFRALSSLGYAPAIPVREEEFADPKVRQRWVSEKNMTVLQFWSDQHRETPVDLFIESPFDFDLEWNRAYQQALEPHAEPIRFASIDSLIAMKEKAGRPQDLADLDQLRWIRDESGNHG